MQASAAAATRGPLIPEYDEKKKRLRLDAAAAGWYSRNAAHVAIANTTGLFIVRVRFAALLCHMSRAALPVLFLEENCHEMQKAQRLQCSQKEVDQFGPYFPAQRSVLDLIQGLSRAAVANLVSLQTS